MAGDRPAEATAESLARLREVSAQFGVPALYVSYQMDEIERIPQHLLFMRAGRVVAAGPLVDLLTDLALPFAARTGAATVPDLPVNAHDGCREIGAGAAVGGLVARIDNDLSNFKLCPSGRMTRRGGFEPSPDLRGGWQSCSTWRGPGKYWCIMNGTNHEYFGGRHLGRIFKHILLTAEVGKRNCPAITWPCKCYRPLTMFLGGKKSEFGVKKYPENTISLIFLV